MVLSLVTLSKNQAFSCTRELAQEANFEQCMQLAKRYPSLDASRLETHIKVIVETLTTGEGATDAVIENAVNAVLAEADAAAIDTRLKGGFFQAVPVGTVLSH